MFTDITQTVWLSKFETVTSGIRLLKLKTIRQININHAMKYFIRQYEVVVQTPPFQGWKS